MRCQPAAGAEPADLRRGDQPSCASPSGYGLNEIPFNEAR
jgi:hypothetical protein